MTNVIEEYYEDAFRSAGEGGYIYKSLSPLEEAGHFRRMDLLAGISLPDIENATVVDYGIGSWGIGCIYPKLKSAKELHGFDVSRYALSCSQALAEKDAQLAGKKVQFHQSSGYELGLPDQSVDIFFAGECIEHIEDTESFLGEVQRVLKIGGIAIFTTPNATPFAYRALGLKWAMGIEHVALMTAQKFLDALGKRFKVRETMSFNSTIHPDLDGATSNEVARQWAEADMDFDDASALIAVVERDERALPAVCRHVFAEIGQAQVVGEKEELSLYGSINGIMVDARGKGEIRVLVPDAAVRANLILWAHPWSGIATVSVGRREVEVDLYNHFEGCVRVEIPGEWLSEGGHISIRASERKNPRSHDFQAIYFRTVFAVR